MDKIFVQEEDLLRDAYRLGVQIFNSGFRPDFIVGLWRGGSTVGIAVQECLQHLGVKTDHISIRTSYRGLSSYPAMVESAGNIRVHGTQYLLENLNAGDALLIVDDVYSTGFSVEAVLQRLSGRLKRNMPVDTRIAAPWYKRGRRRTARAPDYYLYETAHWLVFPYELNGLDLDEIYRHKPFMRPILEPLLRDRTERSPG